MSNTSLQYTALGCLGRTNTRRTTREKAFLSLTVCFHSHSQPRAKAGQHATPHPAPQPCSGEPPASLQGLTAPQARRASRAEALGAPAQPRRVLASHAARGSDARGKGQREQDNKHKLLQQSFREGTRENEDVYE